jgi:hypothetical protein
MPQSRTSASSKGLFSSHGMLCLALVCMIFAWGTGYKLSLYKVECGTSSAPAKVCTRGSDAAKSTFDHAADGPTVALRPLYAAVLISLARGAEEHAVDRPGDEVVSDLSPLRRAPILYLRPPPYEGHFLD